MNSVEHDNDSLSEIENLVGKTMQILGSATSAGPELDYNAVSGPPGGSSGSSQDKGASFDLVNPGPSKQEDVPQLDQKPSVEVDLLGSMSSPAPAVQPLDPLQQDDRRASFEEQPLVDAAEEPAKPSPTTNSAYTSLLQSNMNAGEESRSSNMGALTTAAEAGSSVARSEISEPSTLTSHADAEISPSFTGAGVPDSELPLRVTIREPEKVEGQNALGIKTHYVQYVVRTDSSLPALRADGMEVRRRFSDFDALHKVLKQEYRGYFVPPLPEKAFIAGKMAHDDFIRLRRADLQAFIKSVIVHPALRDSEALKIFLLQPGDLARNPAWTYLVSPPPGLRATLAAPPSPGGGDHGSDAGAASTAGGMLKAGLGQWVSWVKASVAQWQPPKRELEEDELALRQSRELLGDLMRLLELAVDAARSLCGHMEGVCGDVRELGRTLAMLSRFEEAVQAKVGQYTEQGASAASRATDLNKVAYGTAKQHTVWKTLSLKTAASLVTLHDYYVLVPEAISALQAREAALAALHSLQDDLAHKEHQLEVAAGGAARSRVPGMSGPAAGDKRMASLRASITQLEAAIADARKEYVLLKERNQSELARLSLQREADFRRMLSQFARTQAGLVQASADMWASLARQFD
uniref:PX domain-containing protein n=1 Tax=Chlamydomonas leiostraca TaxID=1034604 RepID=A0A7S0RGS5_9CHLO|mmetsp:Transcript_22648/g.57664  ORF Transcript_22648/g.57664 Transcript_22648/m.57664 type:complete len:636 (+) Transcript_22648:218-2125(+)